MASVWSCPSRSTEIHGGTRSHAPLTHFVSREREDARTGDANLRRFRGRKSTEMKSRQNVAEGHKRMHIERGPVIRGAGRTRRPICSTGTDMRERSVGVERNTAGVGTIRGDIATHSFMYATTAFQVNQAILQRQFFFSERAGWVTVCGRTMISSSKSFDILRVFQPRVVCKQNCVEENKSRCTTATFHSGSDLRGLLEPQGRTFTRVLRASITLNCSCLTKLRELVSTCIHPHRKSPLIRKCDGNVGRGISFSSVQMNGHLFVRRSAHVVDTLPYQAYLCKEICRSKNR